MPVVHNRMVPRTGASGQSLGASPWRKYTPMRGVHICPGTGESTAESSLQETTSHENFMPRIPSGLEFLLPVFLPGFPSAIGDLLAQEDRENAPLRGALFRLAGGFAKPGLRGASFFEVGAHGQLVPGQCAHDPGGDLMHATFRAMEPRRTMLNAASCPQRFCAMITPVATSMAVRDRIAALRSSRASRSCAIRRASLQRLRCLLRVGLGAADRRSAKTVPVPAVEIQAARVCPSTCRGTARMDLSPCSSATAVMYAGQRVS